MVAHPTLPSMSVEEYLELEENSAVEVRARCDDGEWQRTNFGPADEVLLPSIGVSIPISAFYEDVELE